MLKRFGRVRSVLDLGAGTADLLDSIPGDLLRIAVDFKIEHLLYLRERSKARRVVADALDLPFRNASVDVITSSHFFHHFNPETNAVILRESRRVARRGVAFTDTRRHYLPLLFTLFLGAFRLVGRITRSDAPGSIRRGYTVDEARRIAAMVDPAQASIVKLFPFRFGIILEK